MRNPNAILPSIVLLFSFGVALASPPLASLSPAEQQNLRMSALELKDAILREDIDGVLKHLRRSTGLGCTDTKISYSEIEEFLHDKKSHLFMSLFDSSRFSKQCGSNYPSEFPAISDKEYFTAETNQSIEIVPYPHDQAKVIFKSNIKGH